MKLNFAAASATPLRRIATNIEGVQPELDDDNTTFLKKA